MRLLGRWLGNHAKPVLTANGPRYQVRWRVLGDGARRPKECKRTDFVTKATAKYFMEELDKAHHGVVDADGRTWRFDEKGQPTNLHAADQTVLGAIELYMRNRWFTEWQDAQRTKVRGRMLRVAIQLTSLSKAKKSVLFEALETQRTDRGARPAPTTTEQWAARWLRDHAFFPNQVIELSPELTQAQAWLETHSLSLCTLGVSDITDLRLLIVGSDSEGKLEHNTRRAYWNGVLVPFLNWLYEAGMVERQMLRGQSKLKRDVHGERPVPTRILAPRDVAALAAWFRRHYGEIWELFPLIATFCSLRIGEALHIRLSDFVVRHGRWHLRVSDQIHRVTKAYSDDGRAKQVSPPKSRRDASPKVREIPLPPKVARRLVELFGERLGVDDTHLFQGPRGAVGNTGDVRKWWETALANVVVPTAPNLAGLTPHAMRHAGMTYWFAQKFDEKLIQRWGGWESLVVMQDTYRGVLESLEEIEFEGLDRFDETWTFEYSTGTVDDPGGEGALGGASIVEFAAWRRGSKGARGIVDRNRRFRQSLGPEMKSLSRPDQGLVSHEVSPSQRSGVVVGTSRSASWPAKRHRDEENAKGEEDHRTPEPHVLPPGDLRQDDRLSRNVLVWV